MAIKFLSDLQVIDSVDASFGNSDDLRVLHDGNHSVIVNSTGDLFIRNDADDADIIFQCDDGSGSRTEYLVMDGSTTENVFYKNVALRDSVEATFGNSNDLQILHDGTNSLIANSTGTLYIRNDADDQDITFQCDSGNGGRTEYFRLDGSAVNINFAATALFRDNVKAVFGTSSDLQIYHDGSNSFIADTGTGKLKVLASQFDVINAANTEFMAEFIENAEVKLYYNNSKKFETTSAGITVTGAITATGDVTAFSDQRLKEDIKPLEDSLEKVQAIKGVSFVKKNDEDKKQNIGFIAQQLKEILPEVVHENEDGIHSVAYGNITALLVEAVKEQQEIISQLEERIVELENR